MSQTRDPEEWLPRISMKLLGTWDPDDELFHASLANGVVTGERIMTIVERLANGTQERVRAPHVAGGTGAQSPSVDLDAFRQGVRGRRYRDLIRHHVDTESALELETATKQTILMLSGEVLGHVGSFIDKWNARVFESSFWDEDCAAVFDAITTEAYVWIVPSSGRLTDEDLFNIFQIVTLNYAYMAATQPNVRRLIGIR